MIYLVTYCEYETEEPLGVFETLKEAKETVDKTCAVEWHEKSVYDTRVVLVGRLEGLHAGNVYIYGLEFGVFDSHPIDMAYDIFDEEGRCAQTRLNT